MKRKFTLTGKNASFVFELPESGAEPRSTHRLWFAGVWFTDHQVNWRRMRNATNIINQYKITQPKYPAFLFQSLNLDYHFPEIRCPLLWKYHVLHTFFLKIFARQPNRRDVCFQVFVMQLYDGTSLATKLTTRYILPISDTL